MGFTKKELIQFLDGLVELASEENKARAVLAKEKLMLYHNTILNSFYSFTSDTSLIPSCKSNL